MNKGEQKWGQGPFKGSYLNDFTTHYLQAMLGNDGCTTRRAVSDSAEKLPPKYIQE